MSVLAALDMIIQLSLHVQQIGQVVKGAQADGRDKLTPEEWNDVLTANDAARARLVAAIEKAERGEG